jgi:hypothetical protein
MKAWLGKQTRALPWQDADRFTIGTERSFQKGMVGSMSITMMFRSNREALERRQEAQVGGRDGQEEPGDPDNPLGTTFH